MVTFGLGAATKVGDQHDAMLFREVFESSYDDLCGYFTRRVGPAVAEDLAAETFARAWGSLARYQRARGALRPWLFGFALNVAREHVRSQGASRTAQLRLVGHAVGDLPVEDVVVDRLHGEWRHGELVTAFAGLSERDQDVLALAKDGGLSMAEMAALYGEPEGTTKARLSRARARLRTRMAVDEAGGEAHG